MKVVLWFTVIATFGAFATGNEFSSSGGNYLLKNYTYQHYPPTRKADEFQTVLTTTAETDKDAVLAALTKEENAARTASIENKITILTTSTPKIVRDFPRIRADLVKRYNQTNFAGREKKLITLENRDSKTTTPIFEIFKSTDSDSVDSTKIFTEKTTDNDEKSADFLSFTVPKLFTEETDNEETKTTDNLVSSSISNTETIIAKEEAESTSAVVDNTIFNGEEISSSVTPDEETKSPRINNKFLDFPSTDETEPSFNTDIVSTFESTTLDETTNSRTTDVTTQDYFNECIEIPDVQFTYFNPSGFSIALQWNDVNTTECPINGYIIYIDDNFANSTSDLNTTITSLYACTTYTVSIAAVSGTKIGNMSEPRSFNTTVPESFNNFGVQNLTIIETSPSTIDVVWEPPPDEVLQCVTTYYLLWWDSINQDMIFEGDLDSNETSYSISLIPCMTHAIELYPKAGTSHNGHEELREYIAPPAPTDPPSIVTFLTGKEEVNITWKTDDRTKNRCTLQAIVARCEAPLDTNSNASWIIRNAQAVVPITTPPSNYRFFMKIQNISPFTNYSCDATVLNAGGESSPAQLIFKTDEDVPSEPQSLEIVNIGTNGFTINWVEPYKIPGIMTFYGLRVDNGGPQDSISTECSNNYTDHYYPIGSELTSYEFTDGVPYYRYIISLYGVDGAGNGTVATIQGVTNSTEPDMIENPTMEPPTYANDENYSAAVTIKFDPPCNINGPFKYYEISYNGTRNGFEDHSGTIQTDSTEQGVTLQPARNYSIKARVVTENFQSLPVSFPTIVSQPGVPTLGLKMNAPTADETEAYFTLQKNAFNNTNGDVIAWALILLTKEEVNGSYGFWDGSDAGWPNLPAHAQQLTPNLWNPFTAGIETLDFTIGNNTSCGAQNYCNKPLSKDTKYWLLIRGFTLAAYKDSALLHFQTEMLDDLNLALILGLVFGLLALVILIIFLIFLWRRKKRNEVVLEEKRPSSVSPTSTPVQKYSIYYAGIQENYNLIKQQFSDLAVQSKEVAGGTTFATLPENKRKNRYTNILPYDETRVTLKIDEDDEISSDYINASYVKGYTGKVEYIATQGPLESTSRNFWQMILQENVSIIVMVSQFVEQTKEKCYQYFPNNHESVYFGENLEVKCSTELHFGTYCVRTLQIRKDTEQRDVVHMQFLEWPDFGVPQGTNNMLEFANNLREKVQKEGGLVVVHCSAGVGRTGTLIALDILLQAIDDHRDINIYKTVLDLRKQRTNMVQTEKQYMFIHTCIKDYLEAPSIQSTDAGPERIYENIDVLRSSSLKKNLIENELESAL